MKTKTLSAACWAAASLATVATILAVSDTAVADTVPFDGLPVMPARAKSAGAQPAAAPPKPATIPATEHVDGIFPALQPAAKRKKTEDAGYHYVNVFTTEHQARDYASDGTYSVPDGDARNVCLSAGSSLQPHLSLYLRTKPYEPPKPTAQQLAALRAAGRPVPKPGAPRPPAPKAAAEKTDTVQRVHLEKLTLSGDTATVETTDAYLDLDTLGARAISSNTTKLARVATGGNGIQVFAARDDQGLAAFLVANPLPAPEADRGVMSTSARELATRLVAQVPQGGAVSSGCGHVHFALATKPGGGTMATVIANVALPPSNDPDELSDDESSGDEDDGDGDAPSQAAIASDKAKTARPGRLRPVAVNVSLSQLASEASPLLSVSFGWAGKDQKMRF